MAAIYYPFTVPPVTGGDFVNLDHVAGLVKAGFDAKVLYCAYDDGLARFSVPAIRLGSAPLRPDDVMVIGESHVELLRQARTIDIRRVLHNQGVFNTFYGFANVHELNQYPFDHILVNSDFGASQLTALGVTHSMSRVRPKVPDYFRPASKTLAIAYSPSKRQTEALFLPNCFKAKAPEFRDVPWIALTGKTRAECAAIMGTSAIFASFAALEGLGLMALEAMASGCHVVGYTGEGGKEFATTDNGDWVAECDHDGFVAALRKACQGFSTKSSDSKIHAGLATGAQFSDANFHKDLISGWSRILGSDIDRYRN